MLKAVAFDLWETIITNTPHASREQTRLRLASMERVLRERNVPASPVDLDRAHRESWDRLQDLYWSRDVDIPCRRQVEQVLELLGIDTIDDEALAALEDAYGNAILDHLPSVVDGAHEVLRELRANGFRIGLISNTGRTPGSALRDVLQRLDLRDSFDVMLFSNEHGECKPQPSIFRALVDGLDAAPEDVLFVGDNLYVDVYGAQRSGLRAVHFIPAQRGTAIAPHVEHGLEIVPDATIHDLRELPPCLKTIPSLYAPSI